MAPIKKAKLRPAFVWLYQKGKTFKAIAEFFGVDRETVSRAIKQFEATGTHKNRKGSGRKRTATSDANISSKS